MSENPEESPFEFFQDTDSSAELPHYYEILDSQREISTKEIRKILADHHAWLKKTRGNAIFPSHWDEWSDGWLLQSNAPKKADLSNIFFPKRAHKNGMVLASDFRFPEDLYEVNFSGANLVDRYFGGANLDGSNFQRSIIPLTFFDCASMICCNLENCYANDTYFIGANLSRANFQKASLVGAKFYDFEHFDEEAIAHGGLFVPQWNPKPTIVRDANFAGATGLNEGQLFWLHFNGATLDEAQKEIAKNFQAQASKRGWEELKRKELQSPRRPQGGTPAPG